MTRQDRLAELGQAWFQLMQSFHVPLRWRLDSYGQICAAYSEPHRYYHDLDHIWHIIAELNDQATMLLAKDIDSLRLAAFYHDLIYDTRRSDNEECSARIAEKQLGQAGIDEDRIRRVCDLIRMTKDHTAPAGDTDAELFLDCDLSILGSIPVQYEVYSKAIRKEYAWVGDHDYYTGRRSVLQRFLGKTAIYRSIHVGPWETHARANIATEIAQIDETLRTLPP